LKWLEYSVLLMAYARNKKELPLSNALKISWSISFLTSAVLV
jgi:hypothetical protein